MVRVAGLVFVTGAAAAEPGPSPQALPCVAALARQSRADDYSFPSDRVSCYSERTIAGDAEFFSGDFHADAGGLTTKYLGSGKVGYQVTIEAPACHARLAGTAVVSGDEPLAASDRNVRLEFWDNGVEVRLGAGSACPGFAQEFFYDPDPTGQLVAVENWSGSGCNLSVAGLEKQAFVRFYYAFKRAVVAGDRQAVAAMVAYPITAYGERGHWQRKLAGPRQLIAAYPRIFDDCMRRAIAKQRMGDLFCRDQGAMLGDGEVWISTAGDGADAPLRVIALNGCPNFFPALEGLADLQVTVAQSQGCPNGQGYSIQVLNHRGPAAVRGAGLTVAMSRALGIRAWHCTPGTGSSCGKLASGAGSAIDSLVTWIDLPPDAGLSYQLCGEKTGPGAITAAIVPSQLPPHLGLVDVNKARATLSVQ